MGYEVYYGTASKVYGLPIDVGNMTTYTLTGLSPGQTYFIAGKAYNNFGKSGYSSEVSGAAPRDINGDGKTDILWRNKSTGQNYVGFYNGANFLSGVFLYEVADTNCWIVSTGDFNNDGKVDILWRNKSTGQNMFWFMDGTTFVNAAFLNTIANTDWEIVGPK
jgi:hypothetical protein